ncbi:UNKNOWN [Stylonychia lemnae]|uniref:Uncharacterized protein n=1 Tax=Stylonychia lemnae TaxID=5949 RepID=A0A077ZTW7_STYLE|nr:UNKNOWN [Stylonychia lemnae]|eukprot:CDW73019.1 UNKNOWN [Stylonychia lemnae]
MRNIHFKYDLPINQSKIYESLIFLEGIENIKKKHDALYSIRQKKLQQIHQENKQFLKRLLDSGPNYNVKQWEIQRQDQEKQAQKLSEYPYIFGTIRKKNRNNQSRNRSENLRKSAYSKKFHSSRLTNYELENDTFYSLPLNQTINGPFVKNQRQMTKQISPLDCMKLPNIDNNRKVIWKQYTFIEKDEDQSLIEISRSDLEYFIIAENQRTYQKYMIRLTLNQGKSLLDSFQQYIPNLITNLIFKQGRLTIKDVEKRLNLNEQMHIPNESLKYPKSKSTLTRKFQPMYQSMSNPKTSQKLRSDYVKVKVRKTDLGFINQDDVIQSRNEQIESNGTRGLQYYIDEYQLAALEIQKQFNQKNQRYFTGYTQNEEKVQTLN